jgi:hypothetical protein
MLDLSAFIETSLIQNSQMSKLQYQHLQFAGMEKMEWLIAHNSLEISL